MEGEGHPATLSRSNSLPSSPSPFATAADLLPPPTKHQPAIATERPSSITRPYRIATPTPTTAASALLQRRSHASQGLSEVKTAHSGSDPSPPPTSALPPPPPPPPPEASSNPPSAYELLHISRSATQLEIRESYRRLARQHHPDKAPADRKEASSILFLQIHSAYAALKDPEARARYDLQLSLQSSQGLSVTPRYCNPSPNVFTPTPRKGFPAGWPYSYTPRSQVNTPRAATGANASSNGVTPRTPFSAGRSWETDQCW